jgi:hypothetical protein
VRGIASIAKLVTPVWASALLDSAAVQGARWPMKIWFELSLAISALEGAATRRTTSAPHVTSPSTTSAPASAYWESGWPAASPAPRSTSTSTCSFFFSDLTTSGTSATRRSPAAVSFGTPIFTRRGRLREVSAARLHAGDGAQTLEGVQLLAAVHMDGGDDQAIDAGGAEALDPLRDFGLGPDQ